MSDPIRVLISDGYRLFREMLSLILKQYENIAIVGEAADEVQTIDIIRDFKPDVALLGISLPEIERLRIITFILQESPETKALIMTASSDAVSIFKWLKAGAKGYVSRDSGGCDLVKAIEVVHHGELWAERKIVSKFLEEGAKERLENSKEEKRLPELTPREQEILRLLTRGLSNKGIAQSLFIHEKTVKSHLNSIFKKLGVNGRTHAILYALHRGLR